jgi:hypothetical protein
MPSHLTFHDGFAASMVWFSSARLRDKIHTTITTRPDPTLGYYVDLIATSSRDWMWAYGPLAGTLVTTSSGNCVYNNVCNWKDGEPNNNGGGEIYAEVRPDGGWNDSPPTQNAGNFIVMYSSYHHY